MNSDIKFYITESLFKLLKNKELSKITITEIVKSSNISRTTFYNNFKNINEVIDYKFNKIINDINKIYSLNKLRKKDNNNLLKEILKYICSNKYTFIIIKNKLYFKFKNKLDNYFIKKCNNINYYIISGIILNLCLLYIDNNFNLEIDKIKIDL